MDLDAEMISLAYRYRWQIELAFKRLVQLLPGVGGKGAEKLFQSFSRQIGDGRLEMGGSLFVEGNVMGRTIMDKHGGTYYGYISRDEKAFDIR